MINKWMRVIVGQLYPDVAAVVDTVGGWLRQPRRGTERSEHDPGYIAATL